MGGKSRVMSSTNEIEQPLLPGERCIISVNQGDREATVLAAIGNKRLLEYEMPNGTSALRIVDITDFTKIVPVSYRTLSLRWLKAIVECGTGRWIGNPQQNYRGTVPSPTEMLEQRQKCKE